MDSTKRGHKNRSGGSYRSEATCQLAGAQTIKHTGKRGLNSFPCTPAVIAPTNLMRLREKEEERERELVTNQFVRSLACLFSSQEETWVVLHLNPAAQIAAENVCSSLLSPSQSPVLLLDCHALHETCRHEGCRGLARRRRGFASAAAALRRFYSRPCLALGAITLLLK